MRARNDIVVAGGMESMTNAPYLLPKMRSGARLGHAEVKDHMFLDGLEDAYDKGRLMGTYAEDCAQAYQFTREAQDAFAIESLKRVQDGQRGRLVRQGDRVRGRGSRGPAPPTSRATSSPSPPTPPRSPSSSPPSARAAR